MQLYGIIYVVVMFTLAAFMAVGGYFIQRDKYWRRTWEKLGKPDVGDIKGLKEYIKDSKLKNISCEI